MQRTYILEQGAYLAKSGQHLSLFKDKQRLTDIPLEGLRQLILIGYTSLSSGVLTALSQARVETVLLDPRGRFLARLNIDEHKHVQRRQAQYIKMAAPETTLLAAKNIVRGKLRNAARLLARRGQSYDSEELLLAASRIKALSDMVPQRTALDDVRGMEGFGANLYFQAFPHLIRVPGFSFTGRNRRPPLDPVNALLSFVYTLLTSEVLTAIKIAGLDPYLGTLHAIAYGRPSLACDLVEEWRSHLGDRLVLTLLNRHTITPEDFIVRNVSHTDGVDEADLKARRPVQMKPEISRAFVKTYERWMATPITWPDSGEKTTYRGLITRQVQKFLAWLLEEEAEYQPFSWSRVG